ncbi:MAG: hypothetical protein KJ737_06775 [Proteobacteria bacterium]|nr:hypothetical protein [Pseudomonadota bacterium]
MEINIDRIQARLLKLRQLLDTCPLYKGAQEEIKQILNQAPQLLMAVEALLRSNDSQVFNQLNDVLTTAETDIEWAVGVAKGDEIVKRIKDGTETHTDLPARERLLNRLLTFSMTFIDKEIYLKLFQEFGGDVDGDRAYMDPGEETEAFSQWLLYDRIIPGQSCVLIKLFAQSKMDELPSDEQALLNGYLKNWPSVFEVIEINRKKNIYTVKDHLSGKHLKFRDKSTSETLKKNAIFIGRAIPFHVGENLYYPLGKILELSDTLWRILSGHVHEWAGAYYREHPGASSQDFFRSINARLRRKLLEITGKKNEHMTAKAEVQRENLAKEIDLFVKQFKKNHSDINEVIAHPEIISLMNRFKSLMDESQPMELDLLCAKYSGFYEFARFVENFASAIQEGVFNDLPGV